MEVATWVEPMRRLLHVAGDFLGRGALLLDRGGDRRGDLGDPPDRAVISLIATTESCVAACMPAIWVEISLVALAVCDASALTSCATTAKPRPASPARAASMVALSASRLVCAAIVVISWVTSPMRLGRKRQFGDPRVGLFGLLDRLVGDPVGIRHLAADFVDGAGHFLRCRGDRLHVGGGLFRSRRDHRGEVLGCRAAVGQDNGGVFQFARCRADVFDDIADRGLKTLGQIVQFGAAGRLPVRGSFLHARRSHVQPWRRPAP